MRYRIKSTGNEVIAEKEFMDEHHPDDYEEVAEPSNRIAEIKRLLAEIDDKSDSPRARREALLGDTSYLASLEVEAQKLRAELKSLEGK